LDAVHVHLIRAIRSDVFGGTVGAAVSFVGPVGAVVGAVAELLETDAGTVRYAKQLTEWALFRIGFCFRRRFRKDLVYLRFTAGAVAFVGSVRTVPVGIAEPLARNAGAALLAFKFVVLANGGSVVELVGIVAAVIGSVADTVHGNARQTVLAAELTFLALSDIQCGSSAVALVGRIGTIR